MEQKKIKTGVIGVGDCGLKRFLPSLARHEEFARLKISSILKKVNING